MRNRKISLAAAFAATSLLLVFVSSAGAAFGIRAIDAGYFDATGVDYNRAGGHPYESSVSFELNFEENEKGEIGADEGTLRNVAVDLPPGFVGNPSAMPACPKNLRIPTVQEVNPVPDSFCPLSSIVGTALVKIGNGDGIKWETYAAPVYNLEPSPGVAAAFGLDLFGALAFIEAGLDPADGYRVHATVRDANNSVPVIGGEVTLWGFPADPSHDAARCSGFLPVGIEFLSPPICTDGPHSAGFPGTAFVTNPTSCSAPGEGLPTSLRVESWKPGLVADSAEFVSHRSPRFEFPTLEGEEPTPPSVWGPTQGTTGCDVVPFDPEIEAATSVPRADSASGLDFEISLPTDGLTDPVEVAQSHLKKAIVTLPEGMSVNPSSASGLGSCAPSQIALGTDLGLKQGEPSCPESSKVGSVEVETPLLEETLTGSVYVAAQNDNPFNSLLALYVVIENPERGVIVKLPGRVDPDPETGRLRATFDNSPQLPFSSLHVQFKSGSRAPLITPSRCGSYEIESDLYPWARPTEPVHQVSTFEVTAGPNGTPCPGPSQFDPSFEAGTLTPIAGAYSPLIVNAARPDGSQALRGISLDLPEGLLGKLAGIPYCTDAALAAAASRSGGAELASPSCPAASQVGTVDVGAGAGSTPIHVQGTAYLAGPYKGAPLSIAVITPALAGPFDLGTVVVRARADVDPVTTQIHVTSDPIPHILQGIPLKVRSVSVDTNKPEFTLNPTDCDPTSFTGNLLSPSLSKPVSDRFQVGACKALDFKPKLALKLKGGTKRGDNPALRATLTMPGGSANIARVSVALPHSEFLDQSHIRTICTRVQFAAKACPPGSVYGKARAFSPLLDEPLEGPVYLRSSDNPLPDLVVALGGQIDVVLSGRIDSVNGGIRNTFSLVPDAPVSKFVLQMQGGMKGLLENSRNLCRSVNRATVKMDAQSGAAYDFRPQLKPACGMRPGR